MRPFLKKGREREGKCSLFGKNVEENEILEEILYLRQLLKRYLCLNQWFLNSSLHALLHDSFAIPPDLLRQVDAFLLDGKPVDDLMQAIIPEGCCLALAAGLPGIAGLAMKSGSVIRGLRTDITHTPATAQPAKHQQAGTIELEQLTLEIV